MEKYIIVWIIVVILEVTYVLNMQEYCIYCRRHSANRYSTSGYKIILSRKSQFAGSHAYRVWY